MKNVSKVWVLAIALAFGAAQAFSQFSWTKDPRNPVFSGGASGTWNFYVAQPNVLFNSDSLKYEMWFVGLSGVPGVNGDYRPYSVGFASSKDGINWTTYPSPVLSPTPGTWDAYTVEAPMVIRQSGQYKMWYTSFLSPTSPNSTGYATSLDGIHWTKYAGNPVLGPGKAAWEAGGPYACDVIPFPGGYKMWYSGSDATFQKGNIGCATSTDGIAWIKDTVNNPVFKAGASGQWDDGVVTTPRVVQTGRTYNLYYTGWRTDTGPRAGGVAISNDTGKTWTRYAGNPVIAPSGVGWDGTWLEVGTVLQRGDTLDMWYDGDVSPISSNRYRIGHASVVITGITEREEEVPHQFTLNQNYPNPFNPSTTIRYELPHVSRVGLKVYNTLAQEVATLVNETKPAGVYTVQFDAGHLASGVYFCRLQAGDFVQTKRMLILK